MSELFKRLFSRIQELTDPIIERVTAPFGITFFIVWCAHNWKLVFSIFNFDSNDLREDKINIILAYNDSGQFFNLSNDFIWIPMFWSFVAMFAYYFLSTLSLGVVTFYERWMRPFVFNILNQNEIVSKEKNTWLRNRVNLLQVESSDYQDKYENIKKEFEKYKTNFNNVSLENEKLVNEKGKLEYIVQLFDSPNVTLFSDNENWKAEFLKMKKNYPVPAWVQLINNIRRHVENGNRYDSRTVNEFLLMGLIEKERELGTTYYKFTKKGEEFIKMLFNELGLERL
ncbi:hypothetical protein [Fulvivirga sp.]|uniref:hypothetical protein n=1 Tax=Fulvivirga sp. TaxID=1931237 RepID=UPI0032EA9115